MLSHFASPVENVNTCCCCTTLGGSLWSAWAARCTRITTSRPYAARTTRRSASIDGIGNGAFPVMGEGQLGSRLCAKRTGKSCVVACCHSVALPCARPTASAVTTSSPLTADLQRSSLSMASSVWRTGSPGVAAAITSATSTSTTLARPTVCCSQAASRSPAPARAEAPPEAPPASAELSAGVVGSLAVE